MANMRRGFADPSAQAASDARANAGTIASNSGRDNMIPAPRKNLRREIDRLAATKVD
jgi:hypothetical protein